MKVTVMGAGGVGGYVGGRLAGAGMDVTLIARGAHLAALKANGLKIETATGTTHLKDIKVCASPAEAGPADLVLFTVKLTDTEATARTMAPLMGSNTRILTLQNGIDSKELLERHLGPGRVAAGTIAIVANIKEPGTILHRGSMHQIAVDAMGGDPVMAELIALNGTLIELDIRADAAPDQMIWNKFVILCAFSGVTCLARSPIGRVYENPATLDFFRTLLEENVAVGRAAGLAFTDDHVEKFVNRFRNQPYASKTSMLLDLEAGKPLELPWLSGRICQLADKFGIPAPANNAVVAALEPYVTGTPQDPT